jgi:hypothetical protein
MAGFCRRTAQCSFPRWRHLYYVLAIQRMNHETSSSTMANTHALRPTRHRAELAYRFPGPPRSIHLLR